MAQNRGDEAQELYLRALRRDPSLVGMYMSIIVYSLLSIAHRPHVTASPIVYACCHRLLPMPVVSIPNTNLYKTIHTVTHAGIS